VKKLLSFIAIPLVLSATAYANTTIFLDAGQLLVSGSAGATLTTGTGNVDPNGSLLLLIDSGNSGVFSGSLNPGQYVGGSDAIITAWSFNTNNGPNETINSFVLSPGAATVGDKLALEWFPSITLGQYLSTGTANVTQGKLFGLYYPGIGTGSILGTPTGSGTDGSSNWVVPADGLGSYDLVFNTVSAAGSEPNSEGFARFTVVPEPSALALVGLGLPLFSRRVRRKILRLK